MEGETPEREDRTDRWRVWMAAAQEGQPEAPAGKEMLDRVVGVRSEGDDEAAQVQKRIDQISDETDDLLAQYRTVLKQIDSIDIYNSQLGDSPGGAGNEADGG